MNDTTRDEEVLGATATRPMRKLEGLRAFGVTVGGSAGLSVASLASVISSLSAILSRRMPSPLSCLGLAATLLYVLVIRPWHMTWGTRPGELTQQLPGDDVLPEYRERLQHAISIDAPAEEVWPWLAQMGQDRGGFYSYEWLENLAGCEMRNADRVHPEWQNRTVGETVFLHPAGGLEVTVFEPPKVLGLRNWGNWILVGDGDAGTRLIARGGTPRGLAGLPYALFMEIPHFVMQRRMLLGIKARAERGRI